MDRCSQRIDACERAYPSRHQIERHFPEYREIRSTLHYGVTALHFASMRYVCTGLWLEPALQPFHARQTPHLDICRSFAICTPARYPSLPRVASGRPRYALAPADNPPKGKVPARRIGHHGDPDHYGVPIRAEIRCLRTGSVFSRCDPPGSLYTLHVETTPHWIACWWERWGQRE